MLWHFPFLVALALKEQHHQELQEDSLTARLVCAAAQLDLIPKTALIL